MDGESLGGTHTLAVPFKHTKAYSQTCITNHLISKCKTYHILTPVDVESVPSKEFKVQRRGTKPITRIAAPLY